MGNPSKKSSSGRVTPKKRSNATSASEWKKGSAVSPLVDLEVPSGKVCQVRPVGMEAFLTAGLIPNSLMAIVKAGMTAADNREEVIEDLTNDVSGEQLVDMIRMFDAVTCHVVVQPRVHPVPENEEGRDDDLLYVDEVDVNDKFFIFNFAVGGTRDLERFRQQQEDAMGTVRDVEITEDPAERVDGDQGHVPGVLL